MPRTARRTRPGLAYHVIWRFVDRGWYFHDDTERQQYLRLLGRALLATDWRCFGYALMSSHVHLYLVAGHAPMSAWSRRAHPYFAQWMNVRHERIGPLFASRARDHAFLPKNEPALLAYIHNNPVRAGVAAHASASTWTSHRAYLGLELAPSWLHVDEGLQRTGLVGVDLNAWAEATPGARVDLELSAARRTLRRRGAAEFATPISDGEQTLIPIVSRPFAHLRVSPTRVVDVVTTIAGVDRLALCSRRRNPTLALARTIVARVGLSVGVTKSELAAALGMSAEGVHRAGLRPISEDGRRIEQAALDWLALEVRGAS